MTNTFSLSIRLHGPLLIQDTSGAPLARLSRRGQALLAFLAATDGFRAERGKLADLLWSDRSEDQARASLRQELSTLRKALPPGTLDADRQSVWLNPAQVTLVPGQGPLLDGFDLASEGFEDWLRAARMQPPPTTVRPDARSVAPVAPAPPVAPAGLRSQASLAVMPFEELGADVGDMFADGVVEEISGALSRVAEFDVIARQSALALRDAGLSVPEAAARLGADYLVEGTVRRAGDRVRIAVQLVRGRDGHLLWSARFDDRLDDLFDLQDRIAMQVAGQLSPNLRAAEIARARTAPPENRSAYDLMMTALPHFWAHRQDANTRAIALLDEAIQRDPDYAPAIAYKSWAVSQQPSYMWSSDPAADHAEALALADRAAQRAGNHAPTLVALSATLSLSSTDGPRALDYVRRALDIDPSNAWGWMRHGWMQIYWGDLDQALSSFDRAMVLSPLDPFRFNMLFGKSAAHRSQGKFDLAIEEIHEGLRASPGTTWAYRMLVGTYIMAGDKTKAAEAARAFLSYYPHITLDYLRACWPRAISGTQPEYYRAFEEAFAESGLPE